jgi:hypothetical protein
MARQDRPEAHAQALGLRLAVAGALDGERLEDGHGQRDER